MVSLGLHAAALAALIGYSTTTDRFGFRYDADTAPMLAGTTITATANQASSLGDIADDEGIVNFEPVIVSRLRQPVIVDEIPPKAEPPKAVALPPEKKPGNVARYCDRKLNIEASSDAAIVKRQETSLPTRTAKSTENDWKFNPSVVAPHMPAREMISSDEPLNEVDPPLAMLPRQSAAAVSVIGRVSVAEEAGVDPSPAPAANEPAGNKYIRRGGHLGRDGSVGNDVSSPEALVHKPPVYPEMARLNAWDGTVVLRLRINESGNVEWVEVAKASGHAILDEAAVAAVRFWQFRPALRDSRGVEVTVLLPIVFDLSQGTRVSEYSTRMSN